MIFGPGQVAQVGKKLYARCAECGGIVRINKPLLGSVHLCSEPS